MLRSQPRYAGNGGHGLLVGENTSAGSQRAMEALLRMKKIDIAELRRVHDTP